MYTATGADSARVRIISAREATRSERRHYENRRVEVQPNNQAFDGWETALPKILGEGWGKNKSLKWTSGTANA